jgi:predicted dehydrogenase
LGLKVSPAAPLRVALVGAGYMGREHARAFASLPVVSVAGIHSRTRARAEALAADFGIPHVCDSIGELRETTHADLVVVAVPELEARRVATACFAFPWTVLLEKPAGYNCEEAEAIAADAQARKARVFVGLNRRHYSSTQRVLAALAPNPAPRFIRVQDQEDPEQALAGGQPALVVSNWMYANSIHLIDFFRIFGRGRVASVDAVAPWNPSRPSTVVSHIRFDSGDQGLYEGYWNAPAPWSVSVTLPTERWELRPIEQASVQMRGERRQTAFDQDPRDVEYKPGLRAQAEAALAAARGQNTALATLQDALETMQLTRRIFGI